MVIASKFSPSVERYFIDKRAGCIAVRDRMYTSPSYQGLHEDTPGVVKYWHGRLDSHGLFSWSVPKEYEEEAMFLCKELNDTL